MKIGCLYEILENSISLFLEEESIGEWFQLSCSSKVCAIGDCSSL